VRQKENEQPRAVTCKQLRSSTAKTPNNLRMVGVAGSRYRAPPRTV
jgi:hypothetical protein